MKKATLFVFALLCTTLGMAQQYQMHVKLNNGTVVDYDVADVESVTWSEKTTGDANFHEGRELVDLGLSVKWATCNVGANSPEEYGDYFAWGETEPKGVYGLSNYFDTLDYGATFVKYNNDGGKVALDSEDDVVHLKWGGDWRMPTAAEQYELHFNCTWTWVSKNGVNGYIVTGPNGNSIFLPAAGGYYDSIFYGAGTYGSYWSCSLVDSYSDGACYLYFDSCNVYVSSGSRCFGLSVRAVCP